MRGSFISKSIYVIFHFKDVVVVLKLEGPNHNGPLSPQKNGGAQVYFYLIKSQKIGGARAPLAR